MNTNIPSSRDRHPPDLGSGIRARDWYQRTVPGGAPQAHAVARAASARGDDSAAIAEYRKVLEANPEDALAYREISKSFERLQDPGSAAATIEESLGREWPQADAALLCMELVELNWTHYHDAATCRALLVQIKETMPGTPYAAAAHQRLVQLNEQVAQEARR